MQTRGRPGSGQAPWTALLYRGVEMTERVHLIDGEEKEKTLCRVHSPYELGKTNRKEEVTCRRCLTKIKNLGGLYGYQRPTISLRR